MEFLATKQGALNYVLDRDLRILEVLPSDEFVSLPTAMRVQGALDHDFGLSELAPLYNVRVVRPGTQPAASALR